MKYDVIILTVLVAYVGFVVGDVWDDFELDQLAMFFLAVLNLSLNWVFQSLREKAHGLPKIG